MVARQSLVKKIAGLVVAILSLLYGAYLFLMVGHMGNSYLLKPCIFYPSYESANDIFHRNSELIEELADYHFVLIPYSCFGMNKAYLKIYFSTKESLRSLKDKLQSSEINKIPIEFINV